MSLSVAVKVLEISDSATIAVCVVSSTVLIHKLVAVTVVGLRLRLRLHVRDLPLTAAVMLFLSMLVGLHIVWLVLKCVVLRCFCFGLVPLGEKWQ